MSPVKSSQPNKQPKITPLMPEYHVKEHLALCKRLLHDVFTVEHLIEFALDRLDSEFATDK